jgi:hypothetical protein
MSNDSISINKNLSETITPNIISSPLSDLILSAEITTGVIEFKNIIVLPQIDPNNIINPAIGDLFYFGNDLVIYTTLGFKTIVGVPV